MNRRVLAGNAEDIDSGQEYFCRALKKFSFSDEGFLSVLCLLLASSTGLWTAVLASTVTDLAPPLGESSTESYISWFTAAFLNIENVGLLTQLT